MDANAETSAVLTTRDFSSTVVPGVSAARDVLQGLLEVTAGGDPYALAPQRWIDELHEVLAVIASRDAQRRYRLDRLTGINRRYLHGHVQGILHDLHRLMAEQALAAV